MGNINIPSLPLAIGLDGTEQVWIVQGGTTDKRTTTRSIASLFPIGLVNPNTIVGNNTGTSAPPADLTASQVQAMIGQFIVGYVGRGVDFNAANTDTVFNVALPAGFSHYAINQIRIGAATTSLTTATVGVFSGVGASGSTIVTSGTAVTVSTAADNTSNNLQSLTPILGTSTSSIVFPQIVFRVQNPQGSAAFANVTLLLTCLS